VSVMRTRAQFLAPLVATVVLVSSIAGCDKQSDVEQPDDKQSDAAKPDAAKPVLTLGAAKVMEKDSPDEAIELLADGTVKFSQNPDEMLKISTDGKVTNAAGAVVAEVGADGSLTFDGKSSGVVLNDTGLTMTFDGKTATVRFTDDGSVVLDPAPSPDDELIAEGCVGPVAKTCALVMTMFLLGSDDEPTVTHEVEARGEEAQLPTVIEAK
jgi:hypothetical protein